MISRNYVLEQSSDREKLVMVLDNACEVINRRSGLVFSYAGIDVEKETNYYLWIEYSENLGWIRLVDDLQIPAQYLEVSIPTEELHAKLYVVLAQHLSLVSCADLKAIARRNVGGDSTAIAKLGLGCRGDYDPETRFLIEKGLRSMQLEVRNSAVLATFLLGWRQFEPAIRRALHSETDADLRLRMEYALQTLR